MFLTTLPGVNYPGGKNGAGVYQTIINQIPPHRIKIEAFGGSAAISRFLKPAEINLIIEINPAVALAIADEFGCVITQAPVGINNYLDEAVRNNYEGSRKLARSPADQNAYSGSREYFAVICDCAISLLSTLPGRADTFIYLDPPYLKETRRSKRPIYEYEFMKPEQHEELLALICDSKAPVAISGYASSLYAERLKDWRCVTFETITRAGTRATECLWMNYPEPLELHDYRYLGTNKTERQRIKRKKARWTEKLRNMPILERQALLSAIKETKISGR